MKRSAPTTITLIASLAAITPALPAAAQNASAPAILQWFEATYETQNHRAADLFMAGYGAVWLPPPGRADSGGFSAGYDVFDNFDLGKPNDRTLYGTEAGIKQLGRTLDQVGAAMHIDLVLNHRGFRDASTGNGIAIDGDQDFIRAGDYPGFVVQDPDGGADPFGVPGTDGDFHSAINIGDPTLEGRLSGLIDIDHDKGLTFIRHPVEPGNPLNIPAGEDNVFGFRTVDQPDPNNARFYPDRDLDPILLFNPLTGEQGIEVYPFNTEDPMAGDPVPETARGLLQRNAQWFVQEVGVDGFRLDATKHFERFVLEDFDAAVYRANPRLNLDGSVNHVFSYVETFDENLNFLDDFIRKDIAPNDPGKIGGNRDALDFAQAGSLRRNLNSNGIGNNWFDVVNNNLDVHDDGLVNGSAGVTFVSSHDEFGPGLSNVAHAYLLMRPGNSVVYYNAKEHGDGRDFPKDGRGDALGNFGDGLTTLVNLRNTHGRGDYRQRWIDGQVLIYERSESALVVLNNRGDAGFDERRVDVDFELGTVLVELTGNAAGSNVIPELVVVDNDTFGGPSKATVRSVRNNGGDQGYLIYGVAGPQSQQGLELSNVDTTIAPDSTTPVGFETANQAQGRARLTEVHVISADQFTATLNTQAVTHTGTVLQNGFLVTNAIRDRDADGDNALLRINGGVDINGNGAVDIVTPGSVAYGFESFDTSDDGFSAVDGNGFYEQVVDTTQLPEGYNFITARAFRHRNPGSGGDGGPAVYTDFKQVIYVDRLDPDSTVDSFEPVTPGINQNRRLVARSVDQTADNIHILLNVGAAVTDDTILGMVNGSNQGSQIDVDAWTRDLNGLQHGNHAITLVTFEMTGNVNVQRFGGQFASTIFGAGLGDLTFDGQFNTADIDAFAALIATENQLFNPAADLNGDGWIGFDDVDLLGDVLFNAGADAATLAAFEVLQGSASVALPEPGTLAALLAVVSGLAFRRRR
ncbi:MAG: PEP-CTERM sorting domain-containing protein [Planctomycetota bacterium]